MDRGAWWAADHGVAKELETTEWLHFHFSLSCIGEGNGNPLQCSCLENFMDRGAWWAADHEVAKELDTTERLTHTHTHHMLWSVFLMRSRGHQANIFCHRGKSSEKQLAQISSDLLSNSKRWELNHLLSALGFVYNTYVGSPLKPKGIRIWRGKNLASEH